MVFLFIISVLGNLILMTKRNCRSVLGFVAPAMIISLSLLILLAAKFSIVSFIIAIYINLLQLLFSAFVVFQVSQQKAKGPTDDFVEYWEGDDNDHMQIRIRVFTTRVTKMFVWQRDKGRCANCGSNQHLEFIYIDPCSKGSSDSFENIQLLCQKCKA